MKKNLKAKGFVDGRVTGNAMLRFKISRAMSDMTMCRLFSLSVNKMRAILSSGDKGVSDPVICYLYRQYVFHPELMDRDVDLRAFYESLGGEDALRSSDFSLYLGRELSAYTRYFRESADGNQSRPAPSLRSMINNAMRLGNGDPVKAFDIIKELCRIEGESRGIDPLADRTWSGNLASRKRASDNRGRPRKAKATTAVKVKAPAKKRSPKKAQLHT